MVFNKKAVLLAPIIAVIIGILSINHTLLLAFLGIIIIISLYIFFWKESRIKKYLPHIMIIVLLQDLIGGFLNDLIPESGVFVSYFDEAIIILFLPVILVKAFLKKEIKGKLVISTFIIILTFGGISSFINQVPILTAFYGAFLMFKGLAFTLIFMNISYNKYDIERYMKWIKVFAIIVVVFAILDFFFYRQLRPILHTDPNVDIRNGMVSVKSLFNHPSVYAWFTIFVGTYLLSWYVVNKNRKYLMYGIFFLAISLLSFRFKSIIAIMIIIIFIYFLTAGLKRALAFMLPASILAATIFLFMGSYIINMVQLTIQRYINVDMYESARNAFYQVSFMIGKNDFPFGEGFGRFGGQVARENYSPVYYQYGMDKIYGLWPSNPMFGTDTYWPYILGETGFIGTFTLFIFYITVIIKLLKSFNSIDGVTIKSFVLFSSLSMLHALTESLGEPVFNSAPQNVFIFISLGIALSFTSAKQEKN
ncbi:hypothetical protein [Niallia sp. MER 6]|uniref:hypothetical protein n=1 Tax=Niallia sp. MER 6 TaxID=2939567 RepID=UPI00203B7026|nr:hypothetical protein [Niallia sp. MER 6]MCM3033901.1 hypothetical protein [Niallia sp. MER 6]